MDRLSDTGDVYSERQSSLVDGVLWSSVSDGAVSRILPDGCSDLMWLDGELVVAGPDSRAYLYESRPGALTAGIRFPPGLGPAVFGVPAHELRNQRIPLAALWSDAEVRRLTDEVGTASNLTTALETIAARQVRAAETVEPVVSVVVSLLAAGSSVSATADAVGFSERQLLRRCLDAFGYGPKTLGRILRMNRALGLARSGTALAEVASLTGYADQAHLTRDVKDLAGVPIGQLG